MINVLGYGGLEHKMRRIVPLVVKVVIWYLEFIVLYCDLKKDLLSFAVGPSLFPKMLIFYFFE